MKKRILPALLCIALLLALCPTAAAAYENMSAGESCVQFICENEGFAAEAYTDGVYWYIGYGNMVGKDDYPQGITPEQAEALVRENLDKCAQGVNRFLEQYNAQLTQNQFDAMCAMSYAFGSSWLNTQNTLPSYVTQGVENYTDTQIVNAFAAWCHMNGQADDALVRRRIAEAKIFLYADYSADTADWCWLKLDADGGNVKSDVSCYLVGEPYGILPECTKDGVYFAGWQKSDGSILTAQDTAQGVEQVRAAWSARDEANSQPEGVEQGPPPAVGEPEPETPVSELYSDVPVQAWYYEYVTRLSERGVINGFDDGTFQPQQSVSYGQALKLILLAAGYAEQEPEEDGHWASGYLSYGVKKGFLADGTVTDLDAPISRNAIADIAAAALELRAESGENPFADTSRSSVLALYAAGIVEGSEENGQRLFKGADEISRAEISAIVWRVAEYVDQNLILYNAHRIPINHELAVNSYDSELFQEADGRLYYNGGDFDVHYGIDVSFYQGDIDWNAVAADGIEFVIIRAGYRGCSEGTLVEDSKFREYIQGAQNAGLDIGLYFFSQAINAEEAAEEARYLMELAKGYNVTYPLAFDWEPLSFSYSRTNNFDYSKLTDCALSFCKTVEAAGYTPMVYYNPSFAYLHYDISRLMDENVVWLAHYTTKTDYYYDFHMWQYGSSGVVDGIAGRVDMDIAFFDLSEFSPKA